MGIIVFFNAVNGKSFVHRGDAWDQEYPIFLYLGRQIRQAILSGNLHFYDFSIGLGADMIASLNHNGFGDPLNLLSVFAVGKAAVYIYAMTLFLRMYLAGIGMVLFADRHKKEEKMCVLAGLSYAFSLFTLTYGFQFYQTLNAAYLFPLLLLQLEKLLHREEKIVRAGVKFALLIAVQACCSYYFLYMQTIVLFVYAIVDFWAEHSGEWHLLWKKVPLCHKILFVGNYDIVNSAFPGSRRFLKECKSRIRY